MVWDLYRDGITFSLLSKFWVCRHRFWLRTVQGLVPDEGFNPKLEFGNFMHIGYEFIDKPDAFVDQKMEEYARKLCAEYPSQQDGTNGIGWWLRVAKGVFRVYREHYRTVDKGTKYLFQEKTFRVPVKLPSGRVVDLRGKWDAAVGRTRDKKKFVLVQENKNKGQIDTVGLTSSLMNDLQTQIYLATFVRWMKTTDDPFIKDAKLSAILYNVVRRPTGWPKSPRQKKEESPFDFADRCIEHHRNNPGDVFFRWEIGISQASIRRFEQQSLFPMLESLCDWWDSIQGNIQEPFNSYETAGDETTVKVGANKHHFIRPNGMYDAMFDGGRGDYFDFLSTGSQLGLKHTDEMFPELAEG
jgi:hypothetical protein